MLNQEFKQALKIISLKLDSNKIKWALIGSTNMQLQGMDVNPNDLDIVIELKDLEKVKEIFSEYNPALNELNPLTKLDTKKSELKFKIDNTDVQIIGEIKGGLYRKKLFENKLIKIKLDNFEIPCFALEAEAETYEKTCRPEKEKIIREFLNK